MRIPDGDLVPRRRHTYGGGYGRRRRLRTRRFAILALVVLVVAAVALWIGRDSKHSAGAANPCPSPTATPKLSALELPPPSQVRVSLLNGTPRQGLATAIGGQLAARGFVVVSTGNAPAAVAGPSVISYGPGSLAAATLLAHHVAGARLVSNPRGAVGSVALVLGADFARLATPVEVLAAARAAGAPSVVPRSSATPGKATCTA